MSKTNTFHRIFTTLVLSVGILLTANGTASTYGAQLTNKGSTPLYERSREVRLLQSRFHEAAPLTAKNDDAQGQLLVGMALILLGFVLHALYIRFEEKRRGERKSRFAVRYREWLDTPMGS